MGHSIQTFLLETEYLHRVEPHFLVSLFPAQMSIDNFVSREPPFALAHFPDQLCNFLIQISVCIFAFPAFQFGLKFWISEKEILEKH
jgi:hypothetical protein